MGVPRINDYTTDLADPPAFAKAASLPANAGARHGVPAGLRGRAGTCCADLHPVRLTAAPADAFPQCWRIATGYAVVDGDRAAIPATGMIEAVVDQTRCSGSRTTWRSACVPRWAAAAR
jgi:hypothetical protein